MRIVTEGGDNAEMRVRVVSEGKVIDEGRVEYEGGDRIS